MALQLSRAIPALRRLEKLFGSGRTWAVLVAVAFVYSLVRAVLTPLPPPPPVLFPVPEFSLTSQEGRTFARRDLDGRVWIAGFFFTRCPTICPLLMGKMNDIQHRSKNLGEGFQMVSFSVDPSFDTPEVMRAYAREMRLTLNRWTLLTGPTGQIQQIVREGFKDHLETAEGIAPADVVHSTRIFLVDRRGRVRGLYDGSKDEEVSRLLRDAGLLVNRRDSE